MEINAQALEQEILDALDKNGIWVLSTSANDYVTARPMSIIHRGLDIYFQSNRDYVKYAQMRTNPHVALTWNNITIEGRAEELGPWGVLADGTLAEQYRDTHENSFKHYAHLKGQTVFHITPIRVRLWKYIEGTPYREILDVAAGEARRLGVL